MYELMAAFLRLVLQNQVPSWKIAYFQVGVGIVPQTEHWVGGSFLLCVLSSHTRLRVNPGSELGLYNGDYYVLCPTLTYALARTSTYTIHIHRYV